MRRSRLTLGGLVTALVFTMIAPAAATPSSPASPASPAQDKSEGFQVVGHNPLHGRGMNSALAVYGDYVYVGSRTDGSPDHPHPGVLVVDSSNPRQPHVVGEIGAPHEGKLSQSSRELRVMPDEQLLMVLNFQCSALIHDCAPGEYKSTVEFFDISDPVQPRHVSTYVPELTPHEMFLWKDPQDPERYLLWQSTPSSSTDPQRPNMIVTDISGARAGQFREVASFNPNATFSESAREDDVRLHSMSVSYDGRRTYLAYLGGGFLIADTSQVAAGQENAQVRLVTKPVDRAHWGDPGAHSAVKVPGRDYALVTDEVYGKFGGVLVEHGCPWGWTRAIDISDEAHPEVVDEFKTKENQPQYCKDVDPRTENFTSYSSHNPTMVGSDLALVTWHSAGLVAIDTSDPTRMRGAGVFKPEPLPSVATEDPALNGGPDKVTMWSYPIVKNGLVYATDIRNGLYILRYQGQRGNPLRDIGFLEGNSNLGDTAHYARKGLF